MKAGGLFDDIEINATEFTPNDLYELDIFLTDSNNRAYDCTIADPNLPYC